MNNKIIGNVYIKDSRGKITIPLVGTKKYPVIWLGVGELGGKNTKYLSFTHSMIPFYSPQFGFSNRTWNLFIHDRITGKIIVKFKKIKFIDGFENIIYFK